MSSTNNGKPYFVFVSAADCPACVSFKPFWGDIKNGLESVCNVVEVNLPFRRSASDVSKYPHPEIIKYVEYFPIFMLVEADAWHGRIPFHAAIFKTPEGRPLRPGSSDHVKKWIETSHQTARERVERQDQTRDQIENPMPIIQKRKLVTSIRGAPFDIK